MENMEITISSSLSLTSSIFEFEKKNILILFNF